MSFVARAFAHNKQIEDDISQKWFIDSGASVHMCNNKRAFSFLTKNTENKKDCISRKWESNWN